MGNLLCCVLVKQSDVAIKERFGKFQKVLNPGLQFVPWVIGDYVAGHLTLRLQQLDVQCETKTKVSSIEHIYTYLLLLTYHLCIRTMCL